MAITLPQIIEWHKEQARKHVEMVCMLEGNLVSSHEPSSPSHRSQNQQPPLILNGSVTAYELEERVQFKSGRIKDLAIHFRVSEETIQNLLEPASRVYIAERGWLKVRE